MPLLLTQGNCEIINVLSHNFFCGNLLWSNGKLIYKCQCGPRLCWDVGDKETEKCDTMRYIWWRLSTKFYGTGGGDLQFSGWEKLRTCSRKQHAPWLFKGHQSWQHLKLRALINTSIVTMMWETSWVLKYILIIRINTTIISAESSSNTTLVRTPG